MLDKVAANVNAACPRRYQSPLLPCILVVVGAIVLLACQPELTTQHPEDASTTQLRASWSPTSAPGTLSSVRKTPGASAGTPSDVPTVVTGPGGVTVDAFEASCPGSPGAPPTGYDYEGEGQARVTNAIFFEHPPFFGFDIRPPEGWLHVSGLPSWAVLDGNLISPVLASRVQPGDADRVLIQGHVQGSFLTASYVGSLSRPPYYYRSLLCAEEILGGSLLPAFDGLTVWVRGKLDATLGVGSFYVLPAGVQLASAYAGREAILGGELRAASLGRVLVTLGVYVREGQEHRRILRRVASSAPAEFTVMGIVKDDVSVGEAIFLDTTDGLIDCSMGGAHEILFADGASASMSDLLAGRRILVIGHVQAGERVAEQIVIQGAETRGPSRVAYWSLEQGGLWSCSPTGTLEARIAPADATDTDPPQVRFSPDGRHAAVVRRDSGIDTIQILEFDLPTRAWAPLGWEWPGYDPAWSPEGSRVVYCRRDGDEASARSSLWLAYLSKREHRQLGGPSAPGHRLVSPAWAPDGRAIAYGLQSNAPTATSELYVLRLPAAPVRILDDVADWQWNPDSTQLLCTRDANVQRLGRLWIVERDGQSPTWLTPPGIRDGMSSWSRDGRQIVFSSLPAGTQIKPQLWLMDADGTRRRQPRPDTPGTMPHFVENGEAVIFQGVAESGRRTGIWRMPLDGSSLWPIGPSDAMLVSTFCEP